MTVGLSVQLQSDVSTIAEGVNVIWVLTVSFLIFFMQPGFALLEAGQVRAKNVANVFMKNIADWSVGVLFYFLVGLAVAGTAAALTAPGPVTGAVFAYLTTPESWIAWLFGAVFAMTAATITSGAVAGRITFAAYVLYAVAVTTVIYPTVQGVVWGGGLLSGDGYLGLLLGVSYLDFAGGTVVHMVGGIAGLVGAWMLGPRQDRFDEDGNSRAIPGHSVLLAMLGTFVLAFGWYGFNVGTQATVLSQEGTLMERELARVALNTTLGMGAGAIASGIVTTVARGRPDPLFTANGLLAGLVGVTSAAGYVTWWGGLVIGAVGGALVYPTYQFVLEDLKIDDVAAVFSVHGAAGGVGAVMIPLFGVDEAGRWTFMGLDQVLMQFLGVGLIGAWTVGTTATAFWVARHTVGLRVDEAAEEEGLDRSEHEITAYPEFAADGGTTAAGGGVGFGGGGPSPAGEGSAVKWRGQTVETDAAAGELFRAFLDGRAAAGWVVNPDGELIAVDERALSWFDTDRATALGAHPRTLAGPDDDSHLFEITAPILDHERRERQTREGVVYAVADPDVEGEASDSDDATNNSDDATNDSDGASGGRDGSTSGSSDLTSDSSDLTGGSGGVNGGRRERRVEATAVPLVVDGELAAVAVGLTDVTRDRGVEAYREAAIERHAEKLSRFADGDLGIERGVPEPSVEAPTARSLSTTFAEIDDDLVDAAEKVARIVQQLPDQSAALAERSEELEATSDEVQTAATEIDDRSSAIRAETATLRDQTEETRRAVEDLSASMEEVTASAAEIGAESRRAADQTAAAVDRAGTAVEQIRSATAASDRAVAQIDELSARMDEIQDTVATVRQIADQTNLLAVNANIEAARAGRSGPANSGAAADNDAPANSGTAADNDAPANSGTATDSGASADTEGFGVVAQEVKRLAEDAAAAADEIDELVEDARTQTAGVTESIHDANAEIETGADAVAEVGDSIERVNERVEATVDGVAEIESEVDRQTTNTREVSGLVAESLDAAETVDDLAGEISARTGDQAEATATVADTAGRLSDIAASVHRGIDAFDVDGDLTVDGAGHDGRQSRR
jgi:Amt family ammonium transporter